MEGTGWRTNWHKFLQTYTQGWHSRQISPTLALLSAGALILFPDAVWKHLVKSSGRRKNYHAHNSRLQRSFQQGSQDGGMDTSGHSEEQIGIISVSSLLSSHPHKTNVAETALCPSCVIPVTDPRHQRPTMFTVLQSMTAKRKNWRRCPSTDEWIYLY